MANTLTERLGIGHHSSVTEAAAPKDLGGAHSLVPTSSSRADRADATTAFRAMYEAHVDFVWRNLRRLGVNESEADDKTQEVFVIAHRRFGEFEDRGHGARAWLFQIVLRVASDARRHRRRHPVDPDGGDSLTKRAIPAAQGEQLERREALFTLDRALEMVQEDRRIVLVLHEIEEMTAPEIADVLSIPLNTVYSRLRLARTELENALSRVSGVRLMQSSTSSSSGSSSSASSSPPSSLKPRTKYAGSGGVR